MAVASRTLRIIKSAYLLASNPRTNYATNPSANYLLTGRHSNNDAKILLFGFQAWPASLRHNKIYTAQVCSYFHTGNSSVEIEIVDGGFNAGTVTFETKPDIIARFASVTNAYEGTDVWADIYTPHDVTVDIPSRMQKATQLLAAGGFYLTDNSTYYSSDPAWYARTTFRNGSAAAVVVTYDDSVKVTSKVNFRTRPTGEVDPMAEQAFTWALIKADSSVYCVDETWEQASATLYWRVSGAETWNAVAAVGSTTGASIPAGSLPAGATIEAYVQATDTDGTTTQTGTYTFTTASTRLLVTQYPSGTSYDTRNETNFAWSVYTSFGEYPQSSAALFWRKSGTTNWNTVSVTGDVKVLTVPANTFPTGATIEWYITATDRDGKTMTLSQLTFRTASSAISATIYPSGKAVESGQPLSFAWVFSNDYGYYPQSSATLYWRASTSDPYQAIQAAGSEQGLTVPKNTFPGNGSTVYWYLEGTDIGGTTTQTRVENFQTVTSKITPQNSPVSGYADPREPITFAWYFATPTAFYDQASASLFWRIAGTANWTEVQASGSTTNVTIPANTFPVASEIEWYIAGTDAGGCSSQSSVYTFSTTASTAYAVCVSPVGRVEDGTKEITYRWIVQNEDGSEPARMRLWWKLPTESQSSWHLLLDTTEQIFEYTVPADTYAAGPIEWRVQATNRDNVDGPANEASFVVLKAPAAPLGLSATAVPLTTIRWQSSGQEAYEIEIDGEVVKREYGPATYSWQVPEPLTDGIHEIRVRVQGSYGLWSNYAETSINVQNVPTGTLTLSGIFSVDAVLTVSPAAEEETTIQWYRDGNRIAKTVGASSFTDRLTLGTHTYFAEIWQADGNYTRSNSVTGTTATKGAVIALLSGGDWLDIRLSENSASTQRFAWSRTTALQHITGAAYPIVEMSPYEDLSGSYECAFSDQAQADAFDQLRGQTVILKTRRGQVIIGPMDNLNKQVKRFYTAYSFSIQRIHVEDFVDGTIS